jgi:hypothetical protein
MHYRLLASAILTAIFSLACTSSESPQGNAGGAAGAPGVGGSAGAPGCPPGSHDEAGTCVATLGAWQTAPSIANARDHHVTFTVVTPSGTFLYVAGGAVDHMSAVQTIERSAVAQDGTLGAWETLSASLAAVGPGVAVADKLVLVNGGLRAGSSVSPKTNLLTVADDGTVTVTSGPDMLHPRFHVGTVTSNGFAYAVGGVQTDGTSQATVERIQFDAQGLGQWIEDRALPKPRSHHGVVAHDGALYVIAGLNRYDGDPFPYSDEDFADILRAPIGDDGSLGEWTKVGELPQVLAVHAAFVHLDQLYVVGGLEGSDTFGIFVGKVQRASIAEDGTVSAFETLPVELPRVRGHSHQAPMVGAAVYSVAGAHEEGTHLLSQADAFYAIFE